MPDAFRVHERFQLAHIASIALLTMQADRDFLHCRKLAIGFRVQRFSKPFADLLLAVQSESV